MFRARRSESGERLDVVVDPPSRPTYCVPPPLGGSGVLKTGDPLTAPAWRTRVRVLVVMLLCLALVVPPGPVFEGASLPRFSVPAFLQLPHVRVPNPLALVAAAWNGAAAWTWHAVTATGEANADDRPAFASGIVTTFAGDGTKADTDGALPAQLSGANGVEIEVSQLFGRPTVPTAGLTLVGF